MDEFLNDLKWFLGWAIPAVIKLALFFAALILTLAMLPFWLAFGMPGLRFMQICALLSALLPVRPYGPPRN